MSIFLGEIKRGSRIPIALSLTSTPTGTPTYRILDSARVEIVAATDLDGSGLLWYKNDQYVESDAAEGEYLVEYSAVVGGITYNDNDSYEIPVSSLTPSSGVSLSGNSNWTLVRDTIIKRSLQYSGTISWDSEPSASEIVLVSDLLNAYVKRLQKKYNLKIWKLVETYKKFSAPSEVTGSDSLIYTCILGHTASSTTKPVTGANWAAYWIVKGTTGGVWTDATAYASTGDFIDGTDLIGVENAKLRTISSTGAHIDSPIEIVGHNEYYSFSNKTSFGDPIRLHFDHKLSLPTIFLYPQLENVDDKLLLYNKIMRVEDFDAAGDTPDFPVDWIDHIVWKMTHSISMINHAPISEQRTYAQEAQQALEDVMYSDKSGKSMQLQVGG